MDRKILHRFFTGTASFEEEEEICDWVDASEKNKEELMKERKYFDILLLHKAKSQDKNSRSFFISSAFRETLKVAVAISILIVCSIYIYNNFTEPAPLVAMNKIVVPPGQRVNITLSDGTNVWLNAGSEMSYPTIFAREARNVSLKGEAYFDVTKDTEHPFIVKTNKCDIKVLGTKFNIQADEKNCDFAAALLEGSIELTNKINPGPKVLLSPMMKAEWKNNRMVIDSIRNLDNYRWKEGLICFEDIRFADLMERFERIYDIRIIIRNKRLYDYKCSGKCRISDGVDFILQVLQRSTHFSFIRSEDNTTIYIK